VEKRRKRGWGVQGRKEGGKIWGRRAGRVRKKWEWKIAKIKGKGKRDRGGIKVVIKKKLKILEINVYILKKKK
jgi:hypothetical protein